MNWLLDSDPAIRWQVLRDLADAPAEVVAAERARVANEGWGARLLALQGEDGQWAGGACFPATRLSLATAMNQGQPWTATLPTLQLLREFGVDPTRRTGAPGGGAGPGPLPLGARRPAVLRRRGRAVHQRPDRRTGRLLRPGRERHRRPPARASSSRTAAGTARRRTARFARRSTPRSTSWKGCWRTSAPPAARAESIAARRRGEEYLLERKLFRRKSTGEVVNPAWLQFSFPDPLALRRAACAGVLPLGRGPAGPARGRSDRAAPLQAAARRHVAAGEHPSRRGPLRARGWRRPAQPVEHAAGAARPQLVRAKRGVIPNPIIGRLVNIGRTQCAPTETGQPTGTLVGAHCCAPAPGVMVVIELRP